MALNEIITVNITRATASVSIQNFGTALALSSHSKFASRIQWLNQATWDTEIAALGFVSSDLTYKAVSAYFAQSPAPTRIALGLRKCTRVTVAIDTVSHLTDYGIGIESATLGTFTDHKFTSDGTATKAEICNGLVNLINIGAEAAKVTASNVGDSVQIDADGTDPFAVKLTWGTTLMTIGVPAGTIEDADTALSAIKLVDFDWYGIGLVDRTSAQQLKVVTWAESNKRLFLTADDDANIINQSKAADTTSLAYTMQSGSRYYSGVMYHSKADGSATDQWPEFAWFGECFPYDPGSQTWCFKTLSGITPDKLTSTQRTNAEAKNANVYVTEAGANITLWGTVGYDYIDVTRGVDWMIARIMEGQFGMMINQRKIPFTDKGIASCEGVVRKVCQDGKDNGFLVGPPVITLVAAADVSSANKLARTYTGLKFSDVLAGAIHKLTISGTVTP